MKQNGNTLEVEDSFYYDEQQQQYFVVKLYSELEIGPAELHITWAGPLVSTLVGINKVTYTDSGQSKYIIATKFEAGIRNDSSKSVGHLCELIPNPVCEPTYAREAFPCFDEPAMKAEFDLVMYHEKSHRALWNMPIAKG